MLIVNILISRRPSQHYFKKEDLLGKFIKGSNRNDSIQYKDEPCNDSNKSHQTHQKDITYLRIYRMKTKWRRFAPTLSRYSGSDAPPRHISLIIRCRGMSPMVALKNNSSMVAGSTRLANGSSWSSREHRSGSRGYDRCVYWGQRVVVSSGYSILLSVVGTWTWLSIGSFVHIP